MSTPDPPRAGLDQTRQTKPPAAPDFAGSVRLCRIAGTAVYVHWSWLLVAVELVGDRPVPYSSRGWDAAELVAVFGIVLLHEFGHVLACRRAGGTADRVVLWPLGGLAFVSPPTRPGADAATTAAGPLVNVLLLPVLYLLAAATAADPETGAWSDAGLLLGQLEWANRVMLVFNLLPVYPLDGGRLLHAGLWWLVGAGRGLVVAAGLGAIAGGGLAAWAASREMVWLAVVAGFLAVQAAGTLPAAVRLMRAERDVRRRAGSSGRGPGTAAVGDSPED